MATFPENLATIENAVLGEDMRTAIHDAVEQAYAHGGEIVLDDVPVSGSNNPVKSGGLYTTLVGKVDTVNGKGLSTNDYTNAEKAKVAEIDNKQEHTSAEQWKPDEATSLYKKIGITPSGYPIWTQPLGASDAYMKGDIVQHTGSLWKSNVDNNVWEPGIYGWDVYEEN